MSAPDLDDPDRVNAILRQYPGPVVITAPAFMRIGACVAAFLFLAAFNWIAWGAVDHWTTQRALFNAVSAVISVATAVMATLGLFPGLNFIKLDAGGFEVRFPWKRQRRSWRDVEEFEVRWRGRQRVVTFRDATPASDSWSDCTAEPSVVK